MFDDDSEKKRIITELPRTWKTWKSQGITNLFKKSGKSQGIYLENVKVQGNVREFESFYFSNMYSHIYLWLICFSLLGP